VGGKGRRRKQSKEAKFETSPIWKDMGGLTSKKGGGTVTAARREKTQRCCRRLLKRLEQGGETAGEFLSRA